MKKHFTLKEANNILFKIRPKIKKIIKTCIKIELMDQINITNEDMFLDHKQAIEESLNYYKLQYVLFKELSSLTEIGIFVKDPAIGLIDFFSKHEGRTVFLCYNYPEREIKFWHELNEGYQGRQPIGLLKQKV